MRRFRLLVAVLVSVAVLAFVVQKIDPREVARVVRSVRYPYLVVAGLGSVLGFALSSARWRYILLPAQDIGWRVLFPITLIGFFSNYVLPAKVGELVRVVLLGRRTHLSASTILATVVLERTLDVLILTVVLLSVLIVLPLPAWMGLVAQIASLALVVVFVALGLLLLRPQVLFAVVDRLVGRFSTRIAGRVVSLLTAFVDGLRVLRGGGNLWAALILSLFYWATIATTQFAVGLALGVRAPWTAFLLLAALLNLIAIVPSLPGRVGTWELVSLGVLGLFGVLRDQAVVFPSLLRVTHLLSLALGYLFLNREGLSMLDITSGTELRRA